MHHLGLLRTVDDWERSEGSPSPLGATWLESEQAFNFALYSRHASGVTLLLYADDPVAPVVVIESRSGAEQERHHLALPRAREVRSWCRVLRLAHSEVLTNPSTGTCTAQRKSSSIRLLTPCTFPARVFARGSVRHRRQRRSRAAGEVLPRQNEHFDWQGAPRPRHSHDTIVYELHVKGFTARANSRPPAQRSAAPSSAGSRRFRTWSIWA